MTDRITIHEVGPRDGLQNEPGIIATDAKIALVDLLSGCGFAHIEVTSFVSPTWVPQLADAGAVMDGIRRTEDAAYAVLTPNMKGLEAAIRHRADEVAIFASASEAFSASNINCSIKESLERFAPVAMAASAEGVPVRGYVSMVIDCPFEGPVGPEQVGDVTAALIALGCYEVSLGETIGSGTPERVDALLAHLLERFPPEVLAGHFHDTEGRALENIEVCLERGLRSVDASIAGLGGCPYAPGARGNVATEAVCALAARLGYETGIEVARLAEAARFARDMVTLRPRGD